MKAIIQRVKNASVEVNGEIVAQIEKGLLILIGIKVNDSEENAEYLVRKICNMRIFEDENEKMNLSVKDINGEVLVVSQFTLYADCTSGNRPSFIKAAKPDEAQRLYEYFKKLLKNEMGKIQNGIFGADMKVSLINDGPVTIDLEV